jgi:uncharacterized membrane protein YeiB
VMPESEAAAFVLQVVLLVSFAALWRRRFERGPLEHVVQLATGRVRTKILEGRGEGRAPQVTA